MNDLKVKEKIAESYLIPVVVIDDAQQAGDTAGALLAGGITVMEITLRTEAGLKAVENAVRSCPEMLVGAGTVLDIEKCKKAISLGASFIVSPGFDAEIVEYCLSNNVAVFPGCVTPTEINTAIKAGLEIIKFFPANVFGGVSGIKGLSGPFPNIKFIPTGGIDLKNLQEYVIPQVFAIGGGWLCERKAIASKNYKAVSETCRSSLVLVKSIREKAGTK